MKKIYVLIIALFLTVSMNDFVNAQYKDRSSATGWGYWAVSPHGGFLLPMGTFADNYKASGRVGLDIDYRVNKETAIFAEFNYNFLANKTEGGPTSSYLSYTVGPRYHFTHPQLKSSIFLEGGVGGYTFTTGTYTINDPIAGTQSLPSTSDTKVGVNAGIGADLNLSTKFDLLVKSKYHMIFTTSGTSSFISVDGGFRFKIY